VLMIQPEERNEGVRKKCAVGGFGMVTKTGRLGVAAARPFFTIHFFFTTPSFSHSTQSVMVNKPPKPAKAPKANRRVKHQNTGSAFMSQFSDDSLFARSQQFVKENDAKPFRDFSYMMFVLLAFIIWRLYVAQQGKNDGKRAL